MAMKPRAIDIREVGDLVALAEEVERSQEPCVLQRDGVDLVVISPAKKPTAPKATAKRPRKTGILTEDDPLFKLIGIGSSNDPDADASKKHEYLARAYKHS